MAFLFVAEKVVLCGVVLCVGVLWFPCRCSWLLLLLCVIVIVYDALSGMFGVWGFEFVCVCLSMLESLGIVGGRV